MIKNILCRSVVVFISYALAFSPLLRAAQLSLPAVDVEAPTITQEKYTDTIDTNKSHTITVTVKDDTAVKQVIVFYRIIGTEKYKSQTMQNIKGSDDYTATISPKQIKPPGIEYYVQALDNAGNSLLHGYSFSPLSVKTVAGSAAVVATTSTDKIPEPSKEDDEGISKWVWIGLGAVVIGAAASGGGGGGTTPTATLSINSAEPVSP